MPSTLNELLRHPQILRLAWHRTLDWYSQTWPPEPELTEWRLDPERFLARLGLELSSGRYRPAPFPLVPHPKKGMQLRHFCMPSVRDQVAFTVVGSLLAPLVEGGMPNFSFGNRIYRRAVRRWRPAGDAAKFDGISATESAPNSKRKKMWDVLPFSLADGHIYQPYRRAHGLFRRSIHWSAAALTKSRVNEGRATDAALRPEDYPWNHIPPFANKRWWEAGKKSSRVGYWARLDLQLAFPSARLDYLDKQLDRLLSDELQQEIADTDRGDWLAEFGRMTWDDSLREFPDDIRTALVSRGVVNELRELLIRWLNQVVYIPLSAGGIESRRLMDLWRPPHSDQQLPIGDGQEHPGIPTGLAVSGLLLNVYLSGFDRHLIGAALDARGRGRPFSVFRFVDDIVLMAADAKSLASAVDETWIGIAGASSVLSTRRSSDIPSNLRVNWEKTEPKSMAALLRGYLSDAWPGAGKCDGCGIVVAPGLDTADAQIEGVGFRHWFEQQREDAAAGKCSVEVGSALSNLKRDAVHRDRLGPFVTFLVERLSALSDDSLFSRFGDGAERRLVDLHGLCRFDFDDRQIKADTRLAFAASSLSRTWLSEVSVESDRDELREIRISIRHAVMNAPAKYTLWRSVVRAAMRRPIGQSDEESSEKDREEARRWLRGMIKLISSADDPRRMPLLMAQSSDGQSPVRCWRHVMGVSFVEDDYRERERVIAWLYCSFLRSCFWRYVRETLGAIDAGCEGLVQDEGAASGWGSNSWLFRALPEAELLKAHEWLGTLDDWFLGAMEHVRSDDWWELDAIALAMLAAVPRRLVLGAARQGSQRVRLDGEPLSVRLCLPASNSLFEGRERIRRKLDEMGRLVGADAFDSRTLLALIAVASRRGGGERALLRWVESAVQVLGDVYSVEEVTNRLGYVNFVSSARLKEWANSARKLLSRWGRARVEPKDGIELFLEHAHYGKLFEVSVGAARVGRRRGAPTLYRVLWGDFWQSRGIRSAKVDPANAPRLGLPIRIALKILGDALDDHLINWDQSASAGRIPPSWEILPPVFKLISWGRRRQLLGGEVEAQVHAPRCAWISVSREPDAWEVLPHPALLLPQSLGLKMGRSGYEVWCSALYFMVACDGHEDVLDVIGRYGAQARALRDTWKIRNRIHLPERFWELLDGIVRQGILATSAFFAGVRQSVLDLRTQISELLKLGVAADDFRWERADVVLNENESQEAPRQISRFILNRASRIPKGMVLREQGLKSELAVRIGQVSAGPDWEQFFRRFPRKLRRADVQSIMREVASAFRVSESRKNLDPAGREDSSKGAIGPALIVLPEVAVPSGEIPSLERLVARERRAILCGEMFRALPVVSPRVRGSGRVRWFVNEASLIFPVASSDERGPPLVRRFVIRKPMPTHAEYGLARSLSERDANVGVRWRILAGQRWYRFVHGQWGDFTVAICSDLVDPSPWWSLRSQVLHVFMCAHNKDVDLFESLSWVRAYENYCNLVSVNHGEAGGSFVWTPRSGYSREVARLRGGGLLLIADVTIPVGELYRAQIEGGQAALDKETKIWLGHGGRREAGFKSPPPTFPSRKR